MNKSQPLPEVAVIGGGIGGLASAAFLIRAGFRVNIFERATAFREVGAGIVVAPNAMRLLARLGLRDEIERVGVRLEAGWEFRRWQDGQVLSSQPLGDLCESMYGEATWTLHRADLLEILRAAVPHHLVHLGAEAVDLVQHEDGAKVTFRDGREVRADCVIVADGLHSALRSHVTHPAAPVFSHLCAWRALVPRDKAPEFAHRPVQSLWLGPGRQVVHYPVSGGRLINIVAGTPAETGELDSWATEGDPSDLLAEFAGWDPRLVQLLSAIERVGRWALFDRDPVDQWVAGRSALLGDAAHPMLAFYAQGAAQAIEDSAALAVSLTSTPHDIPAALERYERVRAGRANRLLVMSRGRQRHHALADGPEQEARDQTLTTEDPLAGSDWIYSYDAEAEAELTDLATLPR